MKPGRINPIVLLIIVACLLFASYNSAVVLLLGLVGETAVGTLTSYSSRLDDQSAPANQSRTVVKGYRFSVGGKEYQGHSTYTSDEAWSALRKGEGRRELIRYLRPFPRVNKPAHLVDFDDLGVAGVLFYVVTILGCAGLFWLLGVKCERNRKNGDESMLEKGPLVGWSEVPSSPEIVETIQKNARSSWQWAWILTLLFPIGFLLAGLISDEVPLGEALVIGNTLGLCMLGINLWRLRSAKKSVWEGVVSKKLEERRYKRDNDGDSQSYLEYIVLIRTEQGKKRRIVERERDRSMYDYLDVGDRVRYHPALETYEKYDKSKDKVIYCNVCRLMNNIGNERCERCKNLLFK